MHELQEKFRALGQRLTPQRQAVYAALREMTDHPTAETIYTRVRETMPSVSLATVYNVLEMLVDRGLARKLQADGPARFDACCTPHAHARCVKCGAVADLPNDVIDSLSDIPAPVGFHTRSVNIEIEGLCARCV